MGKKYVPSGYQIINITQNDVDDDGYLLLDHEDCKIIFEILLNQKMNKPILMSYQSTAASVSLCGFAKIYQSSIVLTEINMDSGSISGGNQVKFILEDNVRVAVVNEEL